MTSHLGIEGEALRAVRSSEDPRNFTSAALDTRLRAKEKGMELDRGPEAKEAWSASIPLVRALRRSQTNGMGVYVYLERHELLGIGSRNWASLVVRW